MQKRYELIGKQFLIVDEELNIYLKAELGFLDKGYFPTGEIRYETYRKEEKLHGPSIYYDPYGNIFSETWYYEGEKMGRSLRFYPNQALYCVERFVGGKAHLVHEYYYLDGSLKTKIGFEEGLYHGETLLFWPNHKLKRRCFFVKGEKVEDHFYDEEGNQIANMDQAVSLS